MEFKSFRVRVKLGFRETTKRFGGKDREAAEKHLRHVATFTRFGGGVLLGVDENGVEHEIMKEVSEAERAKLAKMKATVQKAKPAFDRSEAGQADGATAPTK